MAKTHLRVIDTTTTIMRNVTYPKVVGERKIMTVYTSTSGGTVVTRSKRFTSAISRALGNAAMDHYGFTRSVDIMLTSTLKPVVRIICAPRGVTMSILDRPAFERMRKTYG